MGQLKVFCFHSQDEQKEKDANCNTYTIHSKHKYKYCLFTVRCLPCGLTLLFQEFESLTNYLKHERLSMTLLYTSVLLGCPNCLEMGTFSKRVINICAEVIT